MTEKKKKNAHTQLTHAFLPSNFNFSPVIEFNRDKDRNRNGSDENDDIKNKYEMK